MAVEDARQALSRSRPTLAGVENKQRIHKKVSGWLKKGMVLLVLLTLTLQAGGPGNRPGHWVVDGGPKCCGGG